MDTVALSRYATETETMCDLRRPYSATPSTHTCVRLTGTCSIISDEQRALPVSNATSRHNVIYITVCPPYNAVVRVHDVIARYK